MTRYRGFDLLVACGESIVSNISWHNDLPINLCAQRNQKNALAIFENTLARFEKHLESRTFFVGQQMTIADVAIASSLAFVATKVRTAARVPVYFRINNV